MRWLIIAVLAVVLSGCGAETTGPGENDPSVAALNVIDQPGEPLTAVQREATELYEELYSLHQAGQFGQAVPLAKRGIELAHRAYGNEHPDYAGSLNNLAELYQQMGEYARAEQLFQQALRSELDMAGKTLAWLPEARALSFRETQRGCDVAITLNCRGS